jgi:hypothetical protein
MRERGVTCSPVDEGIGDRVACREAARNGDEVGDHEFLVGLLFNHFENVRNSDALHGIVLHVTAGVEGWLKVDAAHCRVLMAKSMILPISCSLTPRSIAGTSVTFRPMAAKRSRARSFSARMSGSPRMMR